MLEHAYVAENAQIWADHATQACLSREITATGEAAALEPSLWRVQEGETLAEVRNRVDQLADAEIPPVGIGLEAGEALVGVVNAPGAFGRVLLGVDLEPGTYILAGINTDNDGEPAGGTLEQVRLTVS